MQEFYHIDLGVPGLLDRRSATWLRIRILGLLSVEGSRLRRSLAPTVEGPTC